MKRINLKAQFLGLAVVTTAAAGSFLAACSPVTQTSPYAPTQSTSTSPSPAMNHGGMNHGTMPSPDMDLGPADADYDLRFIDAMIPHHQGAVAMAKEAKQKSKHPEIQKLADAIIQAQEQEIAELKQWRTAWYPKASAEPVAYNPKTGKSAPMSPERMQGMMMNGDLGAADAEFDRRFINAMIPHHEGAVTMAKDALSKSKRSEIQALAQDIVRSQEAEIKQMQQWQKSWYGK